MANSRAVKMQKMSEEMVEDANEPGKMVKVDDVTYRQHRKQFRKDVTLAVEGILALEVDEGRPLTEEEKCEFGLVPLAEPVDIQALVAEAMAAKKPNPSVGRKSRTEGEDAFNSGLAKTSADKKPVRAKRKKANF